MSLLVVLAAVTPAILRLLALLTCSHSMAEYMVFLDMDAERNTIALMHNLGNICYPKVVVEAVVDSCDLSNLHADGA
jgi:N-formylglutamate amidohydrolase